jgi:hypothetical protein
MRIGLYSTTKENPVPPIKKERPIQELTFLQIIGRLVLFVTIFYCGAQLVAYLSDLYMEYHP